MGLEDFKQPKSGWMTELESRAESRGFQLNYRHIAANSHYFLITGSATCVVGKTHHTSEEGRDRSYISLNSVEEAGWKDSPQEIPFTIEENCELVDVFGIIIDHYGSSRYDADQDNFLVLTEVFSRKSPSLGRRNSVSSRQDTGIHLESI